jgi:hypothetical protein
VKAGEECNFSPRKRGKNDNFLAVCRILVGPFVEIVKAACNQPA